jgi:hypothetical protein
MVPPDAEEDLSNVENLYLRGYKWNESVSNKDV